MFQFPGDVYCYVLPTCMCLKYFSKYFLARKSPKHRTGKYNHSNYIRTSRRVLSKVSTLMYPGQRINHLRKINPYVFEEMIMTKLESLNNIKIERNQRYSGDGGIDGKFWINDDLYLIQAKRYTKQINLQHVKDFAELVESKGCKGIFVHTGKTPKAAYAILNQYSNIDLISGNRLIKFLELKP